MVRNKLVLRYLLRENLFSFILVFSFSCLLFISIDLIELIRRSSTKEIEISNASYSIKEYKYGNTKLTVIVNE